MANEITIKFGSLALDSTNNITIGNISIKEVKPVTTTSIPKTDGTIAEIAKRTAIQIQVEGDISGSEYDDLRTKIDALKAALQNGLQKFITDNDRYIYAQLKDFEFTYEVMRTFATWRATFIAHYPFWLSETEHTDARTPTSGVGYTINNAGNAPVRVKIEVTAPAGGIADNCQIENTTRGELMKYRGTIAATKILEVDNRYDTDDFEVKNDGVDDHANFEGDFIMLSPGDNTIKYTGTASATVKIYWRDGWY